eukprot:UN22185
MTLSCDPNRSGARIFVMGVKPKLPHQHGAGGADAANADSAVIEDTTSSVENEPFLAKHGHGHHGHKQKKGKSEKKQMGFQLTDICASQAGECTTTMN